MQWLPYPIYACKHYEDMVETFEDACTYSTWMMDNCMLCFGFVVEDTQV